MKKIAIILSAYNGEKYIRQQIESIISQSYEDFDLYIHDDGSTDSTMNIIEEFAMKYSNIKIIVKEKGLRYPKCFIEMLSSIPKYKYYAFSDQDDFWDKNKLKTAIDILDEKDYTLPLLYYTAVEYTDSELHHIRNSRFSEGKKNICKLYFQDLLFGGEALGMTFVFNYEAMKALVEANSIIDCKDWFLKIYCSLCGEVFYNPQSSAKYRRHDMAVTSKSNPSSNLQRYFAQFNEIFIKNDTFSIQKDILKYINEYCFNKVLSDNIELFKLFNNNNVRFKKVFWKKRFRSKLIDEIGYRVAFLFGRI